MGEAGIISFSFNRTTMELKQPEQKRLKRQALAPFNRTTMELKQIM